MFRECLGLDPQGGALRKEVTSVINFNAAQNLLNVLGLPVQQNSNTASLPNNNFQIMIQDILNSQINSEKADVAAAISTDPNIKSALFESVSMIYMLGKIETFASMTTNDIMNEPAVNAAVQNNNLSPEQAQLLANGIKITAVEIVSGNIPVTSAAPAESFLQGPTGNTVPSSEFPPSLSASAGKPVPSSGNAIISTPVAKAPAAVISAVPVNPAVASQQLNIPVNAVVQPASVNPVAPAAPAAPTAVAAPAVIAPAAVKPVQTENQPAVIVNVVNNTAEKPATVVAVTPAVDPKPVPVVIDTLAGKIQAIVSAPGTLDKAAVEEVNRLVAELQNILKDFTALIYKLIEKDEDVPQEAKLINNKVTELANKLSELNTVAVENGQLVKAVTNDAAEILGIIAVALHRITEVFINVVAAKGTNDAGKEIAGIAVSGGGLNSGAYDAGTRQIMVAAGLNDEARDLISQIYTLLKKMNGEIYVQKKIEYVYQPFSNSSSQVTEDGVLLINTAPKTGAPAAPVYNTETVTGLTAGTVQAAVPVGGNTASSAAIRVVESPAAAVQAQVKASPAVINSTAAAAEAVPTQVKYAPAYTPAEKAAMFTADSKSKYVKDVDWLKDSISTYVVKVTGTEDVQMPVDVKVFEKAADFAGRVKESIVIKQVVQNIQSSVQVSGKTEIKMFLRPENMGPVIIRIDSSDKVISGRIEVASTDVKDILKANLPELKAALTSAGLNVSNLDVSVMSNYIGSGMNDSAGNPFREWEGAAVVKPAAEETFENAGALNGVNGYLNFLA